MTPHTLPVPPFPSKAATWGWFLAVFLSIGTLLAAMMVLMFRAETRDDLERAQLEEKLNLSLQEKLIASVLQPVFSDIGFLTRQNELNQWIETGDARYREQIDQEYLAFVAQKGIYDQVRFIDAEGMEICRVNFNNGTPGIVPVSKLQTKRTRYYFTKTLALGPGMIYVSPFDLNIEMGQIEEPLKPVIRIGSPVFDRAGIKRGVLVLNYLGRHLLHAIRRVDAVSAGDTMLLNSDGYWLLAPRSEDEWGFMFEGRRGATFASEFPAEWQKMSMAPSGQIMGDNGLLTFTTVHPATGVSMLTTAVGGRLVDLRDQISADTSGWKLVSAIPKARLQARIRGIRKHFAWIGAVLFLFAGIISALITTAVNRTKSHQMALIHLATTDKLTGLPNRTLFHDRLDQALRQAKRYNRLFALFFIDLDGFKAVNDTLGHNAGDELLAGAADRMVSAVRQSDTVARLGGDEFTIILTSIGQIADAEMVAKKVLTSLSSPFTIQGNTPQVAASIGISIYPGQGETADTMLKKADAAMYRAKRGGKNTYRVFRE